MGSVLNEPLVVSLAAQISTLPLVLLYFGRLSLVALPVNLLIVPVQSAILLLALLAIVVSFIAPVVGTALYWAALVFLSWSIAIVRAFAQLEYADIALHIDGRLIQLFYLLMIGGTMVAAARPPFWNRLIHLVNRRRLLTALAAAAAVALVLLTAMFLSRPDGRLHVWVLDMGHSNAILLQTPGGAQMLIDGGRFPSRLLTAIGDRLPFYDREIEILAITHPDEWDIAAISAVLNRYTVGVALMNGQPNRTEVYQEIQRRLAEAGIHTTVRARGLHNQYGRWRHCRSAPSSSDSANYRCAGRPGDGAARQLRRDIVSAAFGPEPERAAAHDGQRCLALGGRIAASRSWFREVTGQPIPGCSPATDRAPAKRYRSTAATIRIPTRCLDSRI